MSRTWWKAVLAVGSVGVIALAATGVAAATVRTPHAARAPHFTGAVGAVVLHSDNQPIVLAESFSHPTKVSQVPLLKNTSYIVDFSYNLINHGGNIEDSNCQMAGTSGKPVGMTYIAVSVPGLSHESGQLVATVKTGGGSPSVHVTCATTGSGGNAEIYASELVATQVAGVSQS